MLHHGRFLLDFLEFSQFSPLPCVSGAPLSVFLSLSLSCLSMCMSWHGRGSPSWFSSVCTPSCNQLISSCPCVHRCFLKQCFFYVFWSSVHTKAVFQVTDKGAFGKLPPIWQASDTVEIISSPIAVACAWHRLTFAFSWGQKFCDEEKKSIYLSEN